MNFLAAYLTFGLLAALVYLAISKSVARALLMLFFWPLALLVLMLHMR